MMLTLGERVHNLRKDRGMRRKEMRARSGISPGALFDVEKGRVSPRLSTLHLIAEALDVSVTDLLAKTEYAERSKRD